MSVSPAPLALQPVQRGIRPTLAAVLVALTSLGAGTGALAAQSRSDAVGAPGCERTALVLAGGGAKGLAHVGVIQVLDSLGIRPDLVVGTSMGALIGALYASGRNGKQLDSIVRALPIADLLRPNVTPAPPTMTSAIDPFGPWVPLLVWERGGRGVHLRSPAVREAGFNAMLTDVLMEGNLRAGGDFDRLPIPFRAVATDLATKDTAVLSRGDLARAVRASTAIPVVFTPVQIDGHILVDGGLSENVPVSVARAAGATCLIVSSLIGKTYGDTAAAESPVVMVSYLVDLLLRQPSDTVGPRDVRIPSDVSFASTLDFAETLLPQLIDAGHDAADTTMRVWLSRCGDSCPRIAHPASAAYPPLTPVPQLGLVRSRVAALSASGAYRAIWLDPGRLHDSLAISPLAFPSPRQLAGVAVTYDNEMGGRITMGAEDLAAVGGRMMAQIGLTIGEWDQQLMLRGRFFNLPRILRGDTTLADPRRDVSPWNHPFAGALHGTLLVRIGRELVRRFSDSGVEDPPVPVDEAVIFGGADAQWAHGWFAALGPVAHWWNVESLPAGAPENPPPGGELEATPGWYDAFGVLLRGGRALDIDRRSAIALGAAGGVVEAQWTTKFSIAEGTLALPLSVDNFAIRPRLMLGAGSDLPPQSTFILGGTEGFPGLHIEERRGDREIYIGATVAHAIAGPVAVLAEVATGRTAFGGSLFSSVGWVAGGGLGLQVSTPLGPARVTYGYASVGRGAWLVSLGY